VAEKPPKKVPNKLWRGNSSPIKRKRRGLILFQFNIFPVGERDTREKPTSALGDGVKEKLKEEGRSFYRRRKYLKCCGHMTGGGKLKKRRLNPEKRKKRLN